MFKLLPRHIGLIAILLGALAASGCDDELGTDGDQTAVTDGGTTADGAASSSGGADTASSSSSGGTDAGSSSSSGGSDTQTSDAGSSSGGTDAGSSSSSGGTKAETWTIFIYGHADHNLSPSLVADMAEANKAKFGKHIKVFVMADWDASATMNDAGDKYPAGTEWYQLMGGDAEVKPYKTGPEKNLDDPKELQAAIKEIFGANKADRYGLVMWDHGGSFSGGFGHDSQDGTDDESKGMQADVAADAIKKGLDEAGITGDRPLAFLTFDTCLMAGVEVMMPFEKIARLFIANAEIDYGDGWDYTKTLELLDADPNIDLRKFATEENKIWDAHHLASGKLDDKLIRAHASFDTLHMAKFTGAVEALSKAMIAAAGFEWELFGLATFGTLPAYFATADKSGSITATVRDFGQLLTSLQALSSDSAVSKLAKDAYAIFDDFLVANSMGDLRKAQIGLHASAPLANDLANDPKMHTVYEKSAAAWNTATQWGSVLKKVEAAKDDEAPTATVAVESPEKPTTATPPTLQFEVKDKDVAMAKIDLLADNPDNTKQLGSLGLLGMGMIGPDTWELGWQGDVAGIAVSANDVAPATILPWIIGGKKGEFGAQILAVPMKYKSASEEFAVTMLFDAATGKSLNCVIQINESPATFTVEKLASFDPSASLYSGIVAWDKTTLEQTIEYSTTAIPLKGKTEFALDFAQVPAGTYYMRLLLMDVWGNSAVTQHEVELKAQITN